MAEFISQSIPMTPPSIETPEITKPKNKSDPHYFMNNERNMWVSLFVGCIVLLMSTFLPVQFANAPMFKWVGVVLSLLASVIFGTGLYNYKRNLDAGELNEEEYVDWLKASPLLYAIGGVLFILSAMVVYELYWNATRASKSSEPAVSALDDMQSVKSFGSVKSGKSKSSSQGSR